MGETTRTVVQGSGRLTPEEHNALQNEAMKAWQSGDRLSKNLTIHNVRYINRKKAEMLRQKQDNSAVMKKRGGTFKGTF